MAKLAPLKPSLKEKKRYIVFEILSKNKLGDFKSVSRSLWEGFLSFMGELGTAKAGIWLLHDKYDAKKQRGILKVSNKEVDKVKAGFVMINKINGQDVIVRSLGVSGILKKAESKFMNV